jgi:hypothetical protein
MYRQYIYIHTIFTYYIYINKNKIILIVHFIYNIQFVYIYIYIYIRCVYVCKIYRYVYGFRVKFPAVPLWGFSAGRMRRSGEGMPIGMEVCQTLRRQT